MNYLLFKGFFDIIEINNGNIDIIANANGTNKKNMTKYHATLFNPLIDKIFNINVMDKINNISNIISSFGIRIIPINKINNDIDKYTIAGVFIFNFIIYINLFLFLKDILV